MGRDRLVRKVAYEVVTPLDLGNGWRPVDCHQCDPRSSKFDFHGDIFIFIRKADFTRIDKQEDDSAGGEVRNTVDCRCFEVRAISKTDFPLFQPLLDFNWVISKPHYSKFFSIVP